MPMKLHPDLIAKIESTPGATIGGACGSITRQSPVNQIGGEAMNKRIGKSKYRNVPTIYNGVRYSSRAEAAYAKVLDQDIQAGHVRFWVGQPKFRLGVPENVFVADFLVILESGGAYVVDVKGVSTAKFKRDVRLWRAYGKCELHIIRKGKVAEIIMPNGWAEDVA